MTRRTLYSAIAGATELSELVAGVVENERAKTDQHKKRQRSLT